MQYLSLLALVGAATAQGLSKGFNYGNVFTDGSPKQQADFEAEFNRAKTLPNTSGFSSARLYTMIQGGTANTPISAIQAAIDTQTSLLLGLWASASSDVFQNELDALRTAIEQYGTAFTDLIVGISVGSEDLYRISVQGILNESGLGEGPDVLVDYIQRTRSVIAGTAASAASVGHVDTWNDWVNGSNSAVIEAVDWIGFNGEFTRNINYSVQHTNKS
jgi:glucan endo-1,3-beta-D-glucosidase